MGISSFGPVGLNPQTSGMGIDAEFGSGLFTTENVAGHVAYNQAEHTYYFRNVDFNSGFWRENTNSRPNEFTVTNPETGTQRRLRSLRYYSKGHRLINVRNAPVGEWGSRRGGVNSWDTIAPSSKRSTSSRTIPCRNNMFTTPLRRID